MERVDYAAGEMAMCPHREEKWVGLMNTSHLQLIVSDEALMAAFDRSNGEVELRAYRRFTGCRLGALAAVGVSVVGFRSREEQILRIR